MPTPESENRRGQHHQELADGVLWYERDHAVWCARFTQRNAFFDRRGLPPSMESFEAQARELAGGCKIRLL